MATTRHPILESGETVLFLALGAKAPPAPAGFVHPHLVNHPQRFMALGKWYDMYDVILPPLLLWPPFMREWDGLISLILALPHDIAKRFMWMTFAAKEDEGDELPPVRAILSPAPSFTGAPPVTSPGLGCCCHSCLILKVH